MKTGSDRGVFLYEAVASPQKQVASALPKPQSTTEVARAMSGLSKERSDASAFSRAVEESDYRFQLVCNAQLDRISKLPLGKRGNEDVADAVERILKVAQSKADDAAPDWLKEQTFVVQFNPNCPSRYAVRLVTPGTGRLDMKPYAGAREGLTKDTVGFGKTLREAAEAARAKLPSLPEGLVDAVRERRRSKTATA